MASRVSVYRQTLLCVCVCNVLRAMLESSAVLCTPPPGLPAFCVLCQPSPGPSGKVWQQGQRSLPCKAGSGVNDVRSPQLSTGQHRDADDGRAGETAFGTTSCLYIYWCWCSFNNLLSLLEHKAVRVCGMKHFLKGYRSNCIVPKTSGPARRGAALRGMRGMRSSVAQYCGRYQLYLGWK